MNDTRTVSVESELSEEDRLIQATVRDVLERESSRESAREWWHNDADFDRSVWGKLSDLGITNMVATAEFGGLEASPLAAALVSEEIGRAAAALPFEMHSVALQLLSCGSDSPLAEPALSNGVLTAAVEPDSNSLSQEGDLLKGSLTMVPEGAVCDAVLVPFNGQLVAVSAFERQHVATMGMNHFANFTVRESIAGRSASIADTALDASRTFATLLFTSRMVGLGEWMLAECAEYAASRVQFGRPIGSFQAIQHKLAEMHIAMTASRFLTRHAAMTMSEKPDPVAEVARARAFTSTATWRTATEAHQIHGGVGFVLEHPLHLYFAQARGADSLFGSAREHHQHLGRSILVDGEFKRNAMLGVV